MRQLVSPSLKGPAFAIAAAVLFGASTPLAKLIGRDVNPWLLAGLLYLGSGLGLGTWWLYRGTAKAAGGEAALTRADWPWMTAVVFFGGVTGPLLLMFGLRGSSGTAASLLLNLEGVSTMGIAWIVYRENVDRRLLIGAFAIIAGAVALSWNFSAVTFSTSALLIAAACLCWGIDNNFTRKLSAADPVQIAMIKGLVAGTTNVVLGFGHQGQGLTVFMIVAACLLGFISYGISLALFVLALRELGAARTGAYFSIAPFVGAAIAMPLFGEPLTRTMSVSAALMALGVWLHLTEEHDHWHEHESLTHEHPHVHDEHHQHVHGPDDPLGEPHTHLHTHAPLKHRHRHYPDIHHRHGHEPQTGD